MYCVNYVPFWEVCLSWSYDSDTAKVLAPIFDDVAPKVHNDKRGLVEPGPSEIVCQIPSGGWIWNPFLRRSSLICLRIVNAEGLSP